METRLIMLPQPILVSDETATDGDLVVYSSYTPLQLRNNNLYSLADDWLCLPNQNSEFQPYKKIIAGIEGLPKLNLSLIADEIGWVDVEKMAKEYSGMRSAQSSSVDTSLHNARVAAFKEGFKAAQSLNEEKYSEEDMIKAAKYGFEFRDTTMFPDHSFEDSCVNNFKQYLQYISQQPKEYLVEVDMDCTLVGLDLANICSPKITKNKITVTKILK